MPSSPIKPCRQGQDAVLKESYYPTKLLMGAAAGMGIGAGMAAASAPFYEQVDTPL